MGLADLHNIHVCGDKLDLFQNSPVHSAKISLQMRLKEARLGEPMYHSKNRHGHALTVFRMSSINSSAFSMCGACPTFSMTIS